MTYSIRQVDWKTDHQILTGIRTTVFVDEQAVPLERERDDEDEIAIHWLAVDDNQNPVGTARMLNDGHIGRMAVLKSARYNGVGRALLTAAIEYANSDGFLEVYLYAQQQAIGFYHKAGFINYGEEFLDANIPHQAMKLTLNNRRILGKHGGTFVIEEYHSSVLDLISQTNSTLRLLSFDLDHKIYDSIEIVNAISALARKSRQSDIRILVAETSMIVNHGHRLLDLQRRLSSKISIKKVSCEPHLLTQNLVLADNLGFICQSIREPDNIWGNYNNQPTTKTHIEAFDGLWNHAVNDRDLQLLKI